MTACQVIFEVKHNSTHAPEDTEADVEKVEKEIVEMLKENGHD